MVVWATIRWTTDTDGGESALCTAVVLGCLLLSSFPRLLVPQETSSVVLELTSSVLACSTVRLREQVGYVLTAVIEKFIGAFDNV